MLGATESCRLLEKQNRVDSWQDPNLQEDDADRPGITQAAPPEGSEDSEHVAPVTHATGVHSASFTTAYGQYTAVYKDKLMNGCRVLGPMTTTDSAIKSASAVTIAKDGCIATC